MIVAIAITYYTAEGIWGREEVDNKLMLRRGNSVTTCTSILRMIKQGNPWLQTKNLSCFIPILIHKYI